MFTGIVRDKGTVTSVSPAGGDVRLLVRSSHLPWSDFTLGESIAVNGVCLTAVELAADGFASDVSRETLDLTNLGDLKAGAEVNLEPSLALGERLGGHLVSGHVDGVGTIAAIEPDARSVRLRIAPPSELMRYVARKGSVCVDGVSLTINAVSASDFSVNIIPHTAEETIISSYAVGRRVNIEVDLLARYLEQLLTRADESGVTREFLEAHGYVRT